MAVMKLSTYLLHDQVIFCLF